MSTAPAAPIELVAVPTAAASTLRPAASRESPVNAPATTKAASSSAQDAYRVLGSVRPVTAAGGVRRSHSSTHSATPASPSTPLPNWNHS